MKIAVKICLAVIAALGASHIQPVMAQQLAQDAAVASLGAAAISQVASQGSAVEAQARSINKTQAYMEQEEPKSHDTSKIAPAKSPSGDMPKIETPQIASAVPSSVSASDAIASSGPPALGAGKDKEDLSSPKVPDSIKGVIKRLNTVTENVTLDDLNSAREAVAKLDILIDIEKRLTDLSKLRQEREDQSLAGALPASAFGAGTHNPAMVPPYMQMQNPQLVQQSMTPPPLTVSSDSLEVQRIVGAGGRYTATIKSSDGKSLFVNEGDKLSDGSVVQAITSRGVTVVKGNKRHTIQVKDVAVVFNGR